MIKQKSFDGKNKEAITDGHTLVVLQLTDRWQFESRHWQTFILNMCLLLTVEKEKIKSAREWPQ